jgi:regulator of replication initiation timing
MKVEIKEILINKLDAIEELNKNSATIMIGELKETILYITNLQKENEELKVENEKLTQLWLSSQEKRRKAIKYLKQPYRDNFDYSKSKLMEILGDDND